MNGITSIRNALQRDLIDRIDRSPVTLRGEEIIVLNAAKENAVPSDASIDQLRAIVARIEALQ